MPAKARLNNFGETKDRNVVDILIIVIISGENCRIDYKNKKLARVGVT